MCEMNTVVVIMTVNIRPLFIPDIIILLENLDIITIDNAGRGLLSFRHADMSLETRSEAECF